MSRESAVTVCVATGADRRTTKQFLARLAATLGVHDNILLIGRGQPPLTDPAAWRLPVAGELRRVTGKNVPRPRPVVILVEDRVDPVDGWIEQLVDALGLPDVGAAAPLSNASDGDELFVGVPYRPDEHGLCRAFARDLAAASPGDVRDAVMLAGPCLAVRGDVLEAAGGLATHLASGFDPATVAAAVAAAGHRIVVVESCYLHSPGGESRRPDPATAGRPLVSACLIVKDEHDNLPQCLASIVGLVDEIVVYDTGSADDTVEIAEAAGATVVRGFWDDDFARARNVALESCRGQWVLWVDADESVVCDDLRRQRAALADVPTDVEGLVVPIDNSGRNDAAPSFTHSATRLFRRSVAHWQGHIHEQVVARAGRADVATRPAEGLRIAHRGYAQSEVTSKGKGERNLRTAFGDLAGGSDLPWSLRLLSLGRSYVVAGRLEEALDHLRKAAAIVDAPSTARLALRTIAECLLALGRTDEALVDIDRLRAISERPDLANIYEGRARLALGENEAALEAFERVSSEFFEDGWEHSADSLAAVKAQALGALGRHDEAVDVVLACLASSGTLDTHLGMVLETVQAAGRDLAEVYDALGPNRIRPFLPQLLQLQLEPADRALDAWHLRDPSSRLVLAAAAQVARKLDISRQLVWSARLRQAGVSSSCPLVASATDETVAVRDRVLAAAVAVAMFADPRARQAFASAIYSATAVEREELTPEIAAIAPALVPVLEAVPAPTTAAATAAIGAGSTGVEPSVHGRRVLVVDREHATLRSAALASSLAHHGDVVTLLQPLPAASSSDLLEPRGVTVRGWHAAGEEATTWQSSCEHALAWASAERAFDVVIVAVSARQLLPAVRKLLPLASLVVDLDGATTLPEGCRDADLLLSSGPSLAPTPVPLARVEASAREALASRPSVTLEARSGVVVAGNLRLDPDELTQFSSAISPLLAPICDDDSVAICGDDPEQAIAHSLPSAIAVGAVADPSSWIATARVLLVARARGAEHWLAVAARLGTPALVVPDDVARAGEVVVATRALLADDALWQQFAPVVAEPDVPDDPAIDLLAAVPPARSLVPAPQRGAGERAEVRIVGGAYGLESLAQMNRELATHLVAAKPDFDVSMLTHENEPFPCDSVRALANVRVLRSPGPTPPEIEIRHQWPPDFSPPASGKLVCMQPWEFGGLPAEWIAPLRDVAAELWVATSWQREWAIRSGVDADAVHVVPYGVDVDRFRPEGPPYPLRTRKATKLLFVGGLIWRKGVDALLEAYLTTFTGEDDVCLVIKPFGSQGVYRGSALDREVRQAAASDGPEIEMIDGDLDFAEMAALYRSCDVLVHPYRGEGFGMPIAEAMASALPVIVPNGGACLDFCDEHNAWLVGAREVPIASEEWTPSVAGSWWLEPSRRELAEAMQAAVADPETAKRKGAEGRQRIVEQFTWEAASARAIERIDALLAEGPVKRRARHDHTITAGTDHTVTAGTTEEQR